MGKIVLRVVLGMSALMLGIGIIGPLVISHSAANVPAKAAKAPAKKAAAKKANPANNEAMPF